MTKTTLFVCELCRFSADEVSRDGERGGTYFVRQLRQALADRQLESTVTLQPVRCMAGCAQPCNASLAAPGKLTFILSGLAPETTATAVTDFCEQYGAEATGRVPYNDRPATIKAATAFVLPPLPASEVAAR